MFYPLLRQTYYVNLGLKSHFTDWINLHNSIKKSGLRYRNPLPTDGFKNHSSHKSLILLVITVYYHVVFIVINNLSYSP